MNDLGFSVHRAPGSTGGCELSNKNIAGNNLSQIGIRTNYKVKIAKNAINGINAIFDVLAFLICI